MSITTSEMTPADIAAVTNNRGNGGFGDGFGDGWWIILLFLFGFGGRGFGGGFGGGYGGGYGGGMMPCGVPATQTDLAAGFNNSAVLSSLNDIKMGQAQAINYNNQGFNGLNTALLQGFNGVERGFCDISHQLADCCCGTKQAIADVKYTVAQEACETRHAMANNTRDILENANGNTRAILDFLTQDKIATLTAENQRLQLAASQANQNNVIRAAIDASTAEIIRRTGNDCPIPAYVVPNPNCCYQYAQPVNACGGF